MRRRTEKACGREGTRVRSGVALGGQAGGGRASQEVDVASQKRRQAAAEAVVEVSSGGGGRVECAIGRRRRGMGRAEFQRSG